MSKKPAQKGMPGFRGVDHFGLTVPDVEQATRFFCDVLGCEEFYRLGTFQVDDSDWMTQHINVHARAKITNMRMIRMNTGANVELFEYDSPDKREALPRNTDNGGHHFAFYVDDMDEAVEYLRSKGVTICGGPTLNKDNAEDGEWWCYFLTPWGMQMELVSYPGGRGYEKDFKTRLWDARDPAA